MVRTQSVLIEDIGPHVPASVATQAFCTETNIVVSKNCTCCLPCLTGRWPGHDTESRLVALVYKYHALRILVTA